MFRLVVFVVTLVVASCAVSPAGAVVSWRVVKGGSASGQFAVTSINATIAHPKRNGIAVRLTGSVASGQAVVSCSRGFNIASWGKSYSHAGTYVLPQVRNAESCDVIASVGGSGRVVVQILKKYLH
jgi:hypothetical protein